MTLDTYSFSGKSAVSRPSGDPFFLRISSLSVNSFVERLYKSLAWLFKWKQLATITIVLSVFLILNTRGLARIFTDMSTYTFAGSTIFALFYFMCFISIPMALAHEFCHALACKHYGVSAGKLGFGIYYVFPVLFIDTSEAWFCSRKERIFVSVAGLGGTLFIGCIAFALWHLPFPETLLLYFQQVTYFSFVITIYNLCPFIRFDGYFILMDIVNIPNLRTLSFQYIGGLFHFRKKKIAKITSPSTFSMKEKIFLVSFAIVCLVWTVALLGLLFSWIYLLALELKSLSKFFFTEYGPNISNVFRLLLISIYPFILVRKIYIWHRNRNK